MKMHTKSEYEKTLGHRVSKGAWERLNRAYEVHLHPGKFKKVGFDEAGKPVFHQQATLTLLRETPKCNRKVSMRDRFMPIESKRSKYLDKPAGVVK